MVLWSEDADFTKPISVSEPELINLHDSLGRWMRNNWGLWEQNSKLYFYFTKLGIEHPDDMSGIILDSYWRHKHGQPIKLDEQIQYYKDYWWQYDMGRITEG